MYLTDEDLDKIERKRRMREFLQDVKYTSIAVTVSSVLVMACYVIHMLVR